MKYLFLFIILFKFIIVSSYVYNYNNPIINFNNYYLNFTTNSDICNLNFPLQFIKPSCDEININLNKGWDIYKLNNNLLDASFNNYNIHNISKNYINVNIISYNLRRRTRAYATSYLYNKNTENKHIDKFEINSNNRRILIVRLVELYKGVITFNNDKCYILNTNICTYFYYNNMKIILPFIFCIFNILTIFSNLKYYKLLSYLLLFLLISANLFYIIYNIIYCNKCTSLIPLFQHEIGHILGYSHPNEHKDRDIKGIYNYKNCSVNNLYKNTKEYDYNSIMNNKQTYLDRICLSKYDKIGLFDTYKNCNYNEKVDCIDGNYNFFTNYIFLYILLIFIIFLLSFFINKYYDFRFEKKKTKNIIKNININMMIID